VIRQEYYPLLEVKEENAFADLPEDIRTSIKNLNSYTCELITTNASPQDDNQVHEQESVTISSNEFSLDSVDDNQDLI
ncbi:2152_t:CDS:1, partial [Racocetra persica]